MKISIITVSYNSAATIEKTIHSVLSQTYTKIEYIIIDGRSNDGTLDIINKYRNQIASIISEKDKGLYDAMNKGIALATGDYIGILNSDDTFFSTDTIAQVAACLKKNLGIDAVTGDIVQHNGKRILRKYSSKKWNPEKLKMGFMPPHPSIFFKKDLFQKFGDYNLKYSISADYELITRFFLKHQITYKYSEIVTTSMLRGGASSSGLKSYNAITRQVLALLKENEIPHSSIMIQLRFLWKIFEFIRK